MAIRYRPSGEAVATAKAGRIVGQAEARKEAQRQAERQQQISLQQQAQDAARAWEIQKFVLNSQQDFAHEQRLRQADLDAEARAKEWQVEKMELASRMDFEQEERKRIRDRATAIAGRDAILNSDAPETQQAQALFNLWREFPWVTELTQYAGGNLRPERQPSIAEQKWEMLSPEQQKQLAEKPLQTSEFGKPPWWTSPEWKNTAEGKIAAQHYTSETYVQQLAEYIAMEKLNSLGVISAPSQQKTLPDPLGIR